MPRNDGPPSNHDSLDDSAFDDIFADYSFVPEVTDHNFVEPPGVSNDAAFEEETFAHTLDEDVGELSSDPARELTAVRTEYHCGEVEIEYSMAVPLLAPKGFVFHGLSHDQSWEPGEVEALGSAMSFLCQALEGSPDAPLLDILKNWVIAPEDDCYEDGRTGAVESTGRIIRINRKNLANYFSTVATLLHEADHVSEQDDHMTRSEEARNEIRARTNTIARLGRLQSYIDSQDYKPEDKAFWNAELRIEIGKEKHGRMLYQLFEEILLPLATATENLLFSEDIVRYTTAPEREALQSVVDDISLFFEELDEDRRGYDLDESYQDAKDILSSGLAQVASSEELLHYRQRLERLMSSLNRLEQDYFEEFIDSDS